MSTQLPHSLHNPIGIEFVQIPPGTFVMGSLGGDKDERPTHTVRIAQPFYLGQYSVTQSQWEGVMGDNPSASRPHPSRPVEQVSWEDVQAFIRRLNAPEPKAAYRLPTEAEWEYAARASSTTDYSFGDEMRHLDEYAWFCDNSCGATHPVGQLKPNTWDLYDMYGNIWEWVHDRFGHYPSVTASGLPEPASSSVRGLRGGGWSNDAWSCRSAYRSSSHPRFRSDDLGFRLLMTIA